MKDAPAAPLRIDLRTFLEATAATLVFILVGIAAVNLPGPYDILIPLTLGAALVFINRLLGKSAEATVAELRDAMKAMSAQLAVFRSNATARVVSTADEAAAAIRPGAAPPPSA